MARSRKGIASNESFGDMVVQFGQPILPQGILSQEGHGGHLIYKRRQDIAIPSGIVSAQALGAPAALRGTVTATPGGVGSAEAFGPSHKASIWSPSTRLSMTGYWHGTTSSATSFNPWLRRLSLGASGTVGRDMMQPTAGLRPSSGPSTLTGVDISNVATTRVPARFDGSDDFTYTVGRDLLIRDYDSGNAALTPEYWWYALIAITSAPAASSTGTHPVSGLPMYSYRDGGVLFNGGVHFFSTIISAGGGYRVMQSNTTQASDILTGPYSLICAQYHPYVKDGYSAHRVRFKVNAQTWKQVDANNTGTIQFANAAPFKFAATDVNVGGASTNGHFQLMEFGIGNACPPDSEFEFLRRYVNWQYGLAL